MSTCILIPTYDRYRPIAEFTISMLERYWPKHPPVYLCGCKNNTTSQYLALKDDPRDWIGILHSAAEDLINAGHDKAYLIIDDCPPLFECNEQHLGETIPGLLDRVSASYISLIGWDQRREPDSGGEILGGDLWRVQRQSEDFLWRYSAGPGIWRLEALRDILAVLVPTENPMSRSAWAFERRLGRNEVALPERWRNSSYRIYGWGMLGGRFSMLRRVSRQTAYRLYDLCRFVLRFTAGKQTLTRFDSLVSIETSLYDGPYPTYWAGLMTKGELNPNVVKYLAFHRRTDYLGDLRAAVERVQK
ncbi:MAG: hypothetical protein C0404_09110 [Verrucomicrobia bacterium]|nr:hypothetical protein [Verrucomicrobiota bacterium]